MHLDKANIIHEIIRLNIPANQYWVIMGAALVLHGVRESASDIDLGCTSELFNSLLDSGYSLSPSNSGKKKITLCPYIHIYMEWTAENVVFIDDIPVADIYSIISDKERFARPKDLKDINTIKHFISKENDIHD